MSARDKILKCQREIHKSILEEFPDCKCWAIEATKINEKSFLFNVYIDKVKEGEE